MSEREDDVEDLDDTDGGGVSIGPLIWGVLVVAFGVAAMLFGAHLIPYDHYEYFQVPLWFLSLVGACIALAGAGFILRAFVGVDAEGEPRADTGPTTGLFLDLFNLGWPAAFASVVTYATLTGHTGGKVKVGFQLGPIDLGRDLANMPDTGVSRIVFIVLSVLSCTVVCWRLWVIPRNWLRRRRAARS